MKLNGKAVNLLTLRDEMAAAGLDLPALGTVDDELVTYSDKGEIVDLPDIVVAQAVVDAHTPPAPAKTARQVLRDELQAASSLAEVKAALAKWAAA